MPTADAITRVLATMAGELAWLAIVWHVVIGAVLIAMVAGWRPPARVVCVLLVAPILSVAIASVAFGNPFNGISFTLLGVALGMLGARLPAASLATAPGWRRWSGIALMAFGLVYPHFVEGPWHRVVAAAPIGIVPCPTLAFVAGAVILAGGFGSRAIPALLAVWVAFYAYVGIVALRVSLDVGLVVALVGLIAVGVRGRELTAARGT